MKNNKPTIFQIFVTLFLIALGIMVLLQQDQINNILKTLEDVPKRICHDEFETEVWIIDQYREFNYEDEILCEQGVTVLEYESLNKKIITSVLYGDIRGKQCIIKTKTEVCEVK